MDKYEILKNLIKFNTIKDKQNNEIINYIESVLEYKGFKTSYKDKYLIMTYGNNPSFGFLGHTDTVEYIEGWNTNHFTLTEKDNKLYGLGVADMKGGIAAMLDAIINMDLNNIRNGIKLFFTYDEEINFGGIYDILKNGETFPDFMVFGEPTNNEILIGSKGLLEIEFYFNGIKAHSSNPDKGKSANLNAIRFFNELEQFYLKNIKNDLNSKFEIPYTTMNLGILKGGSAKNSIPAECYSTLDFRLTDKKHADLLINYIRAHSKQYSFKYNIIEHINPFVNEIENYNKTANFITEASLVDCKSKIILGVGPVTAHEVDEHISKKSYDMLIEQYKRLINQFA